MIGEVRIETPDQAAVREWGGYQGYKAEMDHAVTRTASGMIRIGYLLRIARDTEILRESGYADVWEFAKAEYGIDKTRASRFISAAQRYGDKGGNLLSEWEGRSSGELIELMQLPEDMAKALPQGLPREEVRDIVRDFKTDSKSQPEEEDADQPDRERNGGAMWDCIYYWLQDHWKVFKQINELEDVWQNYEAVGEGFAEIIRKDFMSIMSAKCPYRGSIIISFSSKVPVIIISKNKTTAPIKADLIGTALYLTVHPGKPWEDAWREEYKTEPPREVTEKEVGKLAQEAEEPYQKPEKAERKPGKTDRDTEKSEKEYKKSLKLIEQLKKLTEPKDIPEDLDENVEPDTEEPDTEPAMAAGRKEPEEKPEPEEQKPEPEPPISGKEMVPGDNRDERISWAFADLQKAAARISAQVMDGNVDWGAERHTLEDLRRSYAAYWELLMDLRNIDASRKGICPHVWRECNKGNDWNVAKEIGMECPRVCCRMCRLQKDCGAKCGGAGTL